MEEKVNIVMSCVDWIIKNLKTKSGSFMMGILFGIIISFPTVYSLSEQDKYNKILLEKKEAKIELLDAEIRESTKNYIKQWGEMLTLLTEVENFLNKKNNNNDKAIDESNELLYKQSQTIKLLEKLDNSDK